MKRLLLIAALAIPVHTSHAAGIPVADLPAIAQRLHEFALQKTRWVNQLRDAATAADKLTRTYDAFTKVTSLHDVFRSPVLRQYIPDDYLSIYNDSMALGLGALFGEPLFLYERGLIREICKDIQRVAMKTNCEARQTSSYRYMATSQAVYDNVVARAEHIEELTAKLDESPNPKEVMDLQALITTEVAAIQNESVRMDALRMAHEASEAMLEQQRSQIASDIWDIEEGIDLKPVDFGNIE